MSSQGKPQQMSGDDYLIAGFLAKWSPEGQVYKIQFADDLEELILKLKHTSFMCGAQVAKSVALTAIDGMGAPPEDRP